jgi:hypothetical protein
MVKSTIAIVGAAAMAAAIVALIPPPQSAVAATEIDVPSLAVATVAAAPIPTADAQADKNCTRAWPYYEQSCLRNSRQSNGKTRLVRVIVDDGSVADRALRARR